MAPSMALFPALVFYIFLMFVSSTHSTDNSSSDSRPESRLINGEVTLPNEFPHQILMVFQRKNNETQGQMCGGSIISNQHILVAAHCVYCGQPEEILVAPGINNIITEPKTFREVSALYIHPCFNPTDNTTLFVNDIAIIKLAKPLNFNRKMLPISIDGQDMASAGVDTTTVGWGITNRNDPKSVSFALRKANLTVSKDECKKSFKQIAPNHDFDINHQSQICTYNSAAFICSGDSGGPLLCKDSSGTNVLCGVTSAEVQTGSQEKLVSCAGPSIFTRVYHYRRWIEAIRNGDIKSTEGCIGTTVTPVCPDNDASLAPPLVILILFSFVGVLLT